MRVLLSARYGGVTMMYFHSWADFSETMWELATEAEDENKRLRPELLTVDIEQTTPNENIPFLGKWALNLILPI